MIYLRLEGAGALLAREIKDYIRKSYVVRVGMSLP